MLFFGHTGITLKAAGILSSAFQARLLPDEKHHLGVAKRASAYSGGADGSSPSLPVASARTRTRRRKGEGIDYRLVLASSLLPDAIDKPTGVFLLPNVFSNGRIFGHTLAFSTALWLLGGYLLTRHQRTWGIVLAYGSTMHLILDRMWSNPKTLLWPLYGWSFEKGDVSHWFMNIIHSLFTDPSDYVPEIIGGAILIQFLFRLTKRRRAGYS